MPYKMRCAVYYLSYLILTTSSLTLSLTNAFVHTPFNVHHPKLRIVRPKSSPQCSSTFLQRPQTPPLRHLNYWNNEVVHANNSCRNSIGIRVGKDGGTKSVQLRAMRPLLEEDDIVTSSEVISTVANINLNDDTITLLDPPTTTTIPVTKDDNYPTNNNNKNNNNEEDRESYVPILILCWFIALLSALDRVAMSVAILPLGSEYHLMDSMKGEIASSVSIGYGLVIIPCGILLSTQSPKKIMAVGIGLWSIATFGTPLAASLINVDAITSTVTLPLTTATTATIVGATTTTITTYAVSNLGPLLSIRALMGAAESVVIPTVQTILANWVPDNRKSIAVATVFSGFQTGTVCAYLVSPWVLENMGGWRGMFYGYGLVGLVWLIPWILVAKDKPRGVGIGNGDGNGDGDDVVNSVVVDVDVDVIALENDTRVQGQMPNLIEAMTTSTTTTKSSPLTTNDETATEASSPLDLIKDAPWKQLLTSKAVWGMTIAHAANNWGLYNFLAWTPTFYTEQYNLDMKDSALLSILPPVAGAICGLLAGYLADKIISNNNDNSNNNNNNDNVLLSSTTTSDEALENRRTTVRRTFQGIALLGPALCLLTLSSHIPDQPLAAQSLLTGTVGLQAFNAAGYGAAAQEKAGERWAGLLYSLTSLPGVLFGSLGVYCTGLILDATEQDWGIVWGINGGVYIVGGLAFILLYDSKKEFD